MKVLEISASGRHEDSVSRMLTREFINALDVGHAVEHVHRDLGDGIPFVDEKWIEANFTPEEDRTPRQRATLEFSDRLVEELKEADVVVIGTPIYNFGVPASLKAWVDMIARARLTFRYTADGPQGLLTGKKAYIVVTSGGVSVDSPVDFATPYLRHALGFVGITDIEVIGAEKLNQARDEAIDDARLRVAELAHLQQAGSSPAIGIAYSA